MNTKKAVKKYIDADDADALRKMHDEATKVVFEDGNNALMYAALHNKFSAMSYLVSLLRRGAFDIHQRNRRGEQLIHIFARKDYYDVTHAILLRGADPASPIAHSHCATHPNVTPLDLAVAHRTRSAHVIRAALQLTDAPH